MKRISVERTCRLVVTILLLVTTANITLAQEPTPTPDQRGLGVQSSTSKAGTQTGQQPREAKPELVLQTGYNNLIGATRFVFSPDGRLLATTTFRSSAIKLWETATGRELRNLSGGTQSGMTLSPAVAFSRDSRLVAAAGGDQVKVWDVVTGREVQTLTSSQNNVAAAIAGVYFVAFTPDNRIITISDAIRIWDSASGQELRAISISALNPEAFMGGAGAAISPDGSQLAFVDDTEKQVKFWDLATGREARSIKLPDQEIDNLELSFTPDGRLLAGGTVNKRLRLWDLSGKATERELGPVTTDFALMKFTRDGKLVALAEDYTIRFWEVATGRELPSLKVPNSGNFTRMGRVVANFSDDGKRVVTGGFDTPTTLWETESGKQLVKMSGRTNMAYKVAFSADGNSLWSGGKTRWDLRAGRGARMAPGPSDNLMGVPSPDGKYLATYTPNSDVVTILELPSGKQLQRLAPSASGSVVQRASFSSDGTMIWTSYGPDPVQQQKQTQPGAGLLSAQLKIWDVKSGRELRTLTPGTPGVDAGFSADGRILGTFGSMGDISLWDVVSGSRLRELKSSPLGNLGSITGGATNPGAINPAAILKGSRGGSMPAMPNLADLSSMMTNMMGAMSAGTMGRSVTSMAFSPDGRIVATG